MARSRRDRAPRTRRQPRSDPRARRARQQPQGRQRRDPEAPADRVHRRLRLGQELARLRHDRRRVAAADQRDLQRLRPGLHADAGAARRRRARGPDDRDQRRPGADRQRPPLTVGTVTDANAMLRILFSRLGKPQIGAPGAYSFNVASVSGSGGITVERGGKTKTEKATLQPHRRHVPALRGPGLGQRLRPDRRSTTRQVAERGRDHDPRLQHGGLVRAHLPRLRLLRPGQADQEVQQAGAARPALQGADEDQGRRHQPDLLGPDPADREVVPLEGPRRDAAAHPRASSSGAVTFTTCPECDGTRLAEGARKSKIEGINIAEACAMEIRDLAEWVRELERAVGGAAARGAAARTSTRSSRSGSATCRSTALGHALGRRGAADEDDPPPRLVADRRHLRLRRADRRPASARHRAHERPAAAAARQGQHGARRRARAGDDRDRRPRRRPRPRRRQRRRRGRASRAPSRACARATRSPASTSTTAPRSRTRCGNRRRRSRSAAPTPTTCRTSTSTSRSACSSSSPASPARARAR